MVSKAALAIPIAVCAAGVSLYTFLTYQRRNKKNDDEIPVRDWTEHRMVLNKAYAQLVLGQLEFIKQTSNTIINVLKIPDEDQTFSIVMKGTPESVQEAELMVNRLIESLPEITTSIIEVPKVICVNNWLANACNVIFYVRRPSSPGIFGMLATTTSQHERAKMVKEACWNASLLLLRILRWLKASDGTKALVLCELLSDVNCSNVVGDFGSSLLKISQETGSRLLLKCDPDFYEASVLNDPDVISKLSDDYFAVSPFYIEIQGPREKNAIAYELIRQTLGKDPTTIQTPSSNKWDNFPKESPLDIINSSQQSKYVEVTISAIITVHKFYVQLCRYSAALAKMEGRLADYFSIRTGPLGKVKKPKIGAMIAVPNAKQGEWHRAQIVGQNEKNVESLTVKAKFVDYGDEEDVKLDEIRSLPTEFSHYPFFAVECSLAGVLSNTLSQDGEEVWSDEALDFFESLVSDKPNKILMARKFGEYEVVSRRTRPGQGRKARYKIPALDVVDTNSAEDIDIALELISKGYARSSVGNETKVQQSNEPAQKPKIVPEGEFDEDEDYDGFSMP